MSRKVCAAMYASASSDPTSFLARHFQVIRTQSLSKISKVFSNILGTAAGSNVDPSAVANDFKVRGVVHDDLIRAAAFVVSDYD